jgi:triacylglycerol esterase/lipase EstA (alpha/beta hydrolase family)
MKIVYIHGATATHNSFAFIQQSINAKNYLYIEYPRELTAFENLENMKDIIVNNVNEPMFVICHSLGGIYALHLLEHFPNIRRVVSLATPFAGSDIAVWGKIMNPSYKLFNDITPNSEFIKSCKYIKVQVPWTQIVTTTGEVPWMEQPNDGVVTKKSMTARTDIDYVEIPNNHYEIVQCTRAVEVIKKSLVEIRKN